MRDLLGFLRAFKGDGIEDRVRPNPNVGLAFFVAALIVALAGFKWLDGGGSLTGGDDDWTLGGYVRGGEVAAPIPPSPAAEAVAVDGAGTGDGDDGGETTATSILPDGTPIVISGPGSTGSTGSTGTPGSGSSTTGSTGTGGSTSTVVTTVASTSPSTEPETTTTTDDPSTTETTESTTTTVTEPGASPSLTGTVGDLVDALGSSLPP